MLTKTKMDKKAKKQKSMISSKNTDLVHTSPIPLGVRAGDFVFLSAVRGVKPGTAFVEEADPELQTIQLFSNLEGILESLELSFDSVVKVGVYMKNLQRDRLIFNKYWRDNFGDSLPARHAVQVSDLGDEKGLTLFLLDVTIYDPR
tara:strand:- start:1009 stop:1446 length:438 start_codon:yes stop_codon:yes gene_type:complete